MSGTLFNVRRVSLRITLRLTILLTLVCGAVAQAADIKVRLRNDLTSGTLVVYDLLIRGERATPTPAYVEKVTFEQPGTLTLVVLEAPDPRHARRVWMMTLDEPKVVGLTRDDQPVDEPPDARALGLPPAASQLRLATITAEQADASPVGGSRVQRAALLLALDFARWPDRLVGAGEEWEIPAQRDELSGKWMYTYSGTEGRGADRLALGTFAFTGTLAGEYANDAEIERVAGRWQWRVAKRGLESSSSEVVLGYGPSGARRSLSFNVELSVRSRDYLERDALETARADLQALSDAASGGGPSSGDRSALERFIAEHPKSLWLPVAHDLFERVTVSEEKLASLDPDDLRDSLVALITRWQRAAITGSVEALQPIRATFHELMNTNRSEMYGLCADADANTRAMAVFCVAFGDQPGDLAKVETACDDGEARVRMWAAYGLAERRDPATNHDLLWKLLGDDDDKVRCRACMAVTTCVERKANDRDRFMKRLLTIIESDKSDEVHPFAAQAIDAIAKREDLEALIHAEQIEEVPKARWQLENTIKRLGGKPK
ncbi:MAG: HEAT repeat domain-containing protein [Phycisphaerales bacterium]|nr:HEAT repeat domain-containing protein [Phycisphaerales bacterium]